MEKATDSHSSSFFLIFLSNGSQTNCGLQSVWPLGVLGLCLLNFLCPWGRDLLTLVMYSLLAEYSWRVYKLVRSSSESEVSPAAAYSLMGRQGVHNSHFLYQAVREQREAKGSWEAV